jgi:hypothetical protein
MDIRGFYDLWESNGDGFPIKQFGELPEFCEPNFKEGDPSTMIFMEGWKVRSTGDAIADRELGRRYAEMAVAYARKTGSPAFVSFVLGEINLRAALNNISDGSASSTLAIEYGFFERLAQIAFCGSLN